MRIESGFVDYIISLGHDISFFAELDDHHVIYLSKEKRKNIEKVHIRVDFNSEVQFFAFKKLEFRKFIALVQGLYASIVDKPIDINFLDKIFFFNRSLLSKTRLNDNKVLYLAKNKNEISVIVRCNYYGNITQFEMKDALFRKITALEEIELFLSEKRE